MLHNAGWVLHDRTARRAAESILWVLCLGLPLWAGGALAGAQLAAAGASAVALALAARGTPGPWRPQPLGWALAGLFAWSALQLVPLPAALVSLLSPRAASVWAGAGAAGCHPLTLDVPATAAAASRAFTVAACYLAAERLGESGRARTRLAAAVAGAGILAVLVGFAHRLMGVEQVFGAWEVHGETGQFSAPFVNPNHLASLVALSACAALGLAAAAADRRRRAAWLGAAVLAGAGSVLTLSRGGAMAFFLGLALMGGLLARVRRAVGGTPPRGAPAGAWLVPAAALAVASLAAYLAFDRIALDARSALPAAERKVRPWGPAWRMALDAPVTGLGRGAFATAHAAYKTTPERMTYTHAENEILELLAEVGVGWTVLVAAALAWLLVRALGLRRASHQGIEAGLVAGVAAVAAHNLADFSLELVGVAAPWAVAAGLLGGGPRREGETRVRRWGPWAALAGGLASALASAYGQVEHADRALERLQSAPPAQIPALFAREARLHPADPLLPLAAGARLADAPLPAPKDALRLLERAGKLSPSSPDPHLFAARALHALGAREKALAQVRTALHKGADPKDGVAAALWIGRTVEEWLRGVPGTPQGFGWLSDGAWDAGKRAEAHRVAVSLLELFGPGEGAAARAARQALELGRAADAAGFARAWIGHDPSSRDARIVLARALESMGNLEGARAAFVAAERTAPGDPEVALAAASFLLARDEAEAALAALARAHVDPRDRPRRAALHSMRGRALERLGLAARAASEHRAAARDAPTIAEHWLEAARLLEELGRPDEAAQELELGMASATPAGRALLAERLARVRAER